MILTALPKASPGGRLFFFIVPVAFLLWFALFYSQRPDGIPVTIGLATEDAAAAACNSSCGAGKTNTVGGVQRKGNTDDGEGSQRPPTTPPPPDPCSGRYVYVHDLPRRFNADILRECRSLSPLRDKSRFMSNAGLGQPIGDSAAVFSGSGGWYATDQFALDVIFYHRMRQYACLTTDSATASALYVPFFAGLEASRHLLSRNTSLRDSASVDLARWLRSRPEWEVAGGRDHFLVAGRVAWDFQRSGNSYAVWGNQLLLLPEIRNMSVLVPESRTWGGNDISIPYPTYFHPSEDGQVFEWQRRMRGMERPWLFTFAGARRPVLTENIRGQIIEQCRGSPRCQLLDCSVPSGGCGSPGSVTGAFQRSSFCLQPSGDSFTRRSTFDSMVAGCVPVFFHPAAAYKQYPWHLPENHSSYSVFISEEAVREGKVSIEGRLAALPEGAVRAMREEVVKMLPKLVYAAPSAGGMRLKDAFDVAVEGVIQRAGGLRKRSGKSPPPPPRRGLK